MNSYKYEIWFRHRNFEKDFEIVTIESENETEARLIVKGLREWVFKIDLISINGININ